MSDRPKTASSAPKHKPGALLAVIVVPVIFAFTLWTFAWPAARLEPRDLPLGLAGPAETTRVVEEQLGAQGNAFELHRYADEQSAREAIENREIYGAVVASGGRVTLLTASASSPLVAGMLENMARSAVPETAAASSPVQTQDVVPADSDDPRGLVLNSLLLPLVLSSVIAAVILVALGRRRLEQAGALIAAAALAGVVGIAMIQSWLGALSGPWLTNAGVLCLTMLAIASLLVGLASLLGRAGLALGALTMILIANPWSGISSAPELLPQPTGLIGQLLPPGAGGNLLRSTAFFDGAGADMHLIVLVGWTVIGLSAMWAGLFLQRRRASAFAVEPSMRPLANADRAA